MSGRVLGVQICWNWTQIYSYFGNMIPKGFVKYSQSFRYALKWKPFQCEMHLIPGPDYVRNKRWKFCKILPKFIWHQRIHIKRLLHAPKSNKYIYKHTTEKSIFIFDIPPPEKIFYWFLYFAKQIYILLPLFPFEL